MGLMFPVAFLLYEVIERPCVNSERRWLKASVEQWRAASLLGRPGACLAIADLLVSLFCGLKFQARILSDISSCGAPLGCKLPDIL